MSDKPRSLFSGIITFLCILLVILILSLAAVPLITSNTRDARGAYEDMQRSMLPERRLPPPVNRPGPQPRPRKYKETFFHDWGVTPFVDTEDDALSTFGLDVDTASYVLASTYIKRGASATPAMVRVEEFVNAFDYGYSAPRAGSLGIELACAPSPFGRDLQNCYLLRVAIKAREPSETRRPMILTAVVDTSGSMSDGRLALVKEYLTSVVGLLRAEDRLGIVEFSSHARVVCAHLSGDRREALRRAINGLRTSDRTNAEAGMNLGYEQARAAYRKDANNRVLLFSDGVANVGSTDAVSILAGVELGRGDGVCLSTIGVGTANYSDVLMEQLADKGMGAYSYLACADQIASAFRGGLERRLDVAAQDARIQVAFNAEVVKSYRLIGYDNRQIADHELKVMNHKGAVISPGQEVTALYEVKLVDDAAGELCNATLRWKEPSGGEIHELAGRIATSQIIGEWNDAPDNLRLAACVAEFGELLKQSFWAKGSNFKEVRAELQKVPKQRAADLLDILALLETP